MQQGKSFVKALRAKSFIKVLLAKIYNIFAFIDSITSCDMELLDNIDYFFYFKRNELKIINKACILNNIKCHEIVFSKCTELQEHD